MRYSLPTIPPSTRSEPAEAPASAHMASVISRVWNAVASSAARARCALVWNLVSPTITPRASGRHRGASRPEKAGTR